MGTPSCETLAGNAVSCPQNLAGPSDPRPCETRSPALSAYGNTQSRTAKPRNRRFLDDHGSRASTKLVADSPLRIREPPRRCKPYEAMKSPGMRKTRRLEGQTRASPTASTGCAVFAKAGFLCDNKRHQFRGFNRPVGAAGAQVPYKHKVTGSNPVPATIKTAGQTFFV